MTERVNNKNSFFGSLVRLLLAAEKWFATLLYFYLTEPFFLLYIKEGFSWVTRLNFYLGNLLFWIVFGLLALRWKRSIGVVSRGKFLLIFVAITIISTVWSDFPKDSQNQGIRLLQTTLMGAYLASRYSLKEQTRMMTLMFGIAAVLSLLYVFAQPQYGVMHKLSLAGSWRGIFVHKNTLGRMMVIGAMFFLINGLSKPRKNWIGWAFLLLAIQLILGTNSKGALVSFFALVFISPAYRIFRWNPAISIPLYLIILLLVGNVATWLTDNWITALASIGKDDTLNGRVPIWEIITERIQERPWLGYGYFGFWQDWKGKWSAMIFRAIPWHPDQAHNGFLDVVLQLGIVGGVVFMLAFLDAIVKAVNWIRLTRTVENFWPLGFMSYFVFMNLSQTIIMSPYTLVWVLFTTISFSEIELPDRVSQTDPNHLRTNNLTKKITKRLAK